MPTCFARASMSGTFSWLRMALKAAEAVEERAAVSATRDNFNETTSWITSDRQSTIEEPIAQIRIKQGFKYEGHATSSVMGWDNFFAREKWTTGLAKPSGIKGPLAVSLGCLA